MSPSTPGDRRGVLDASAVLAWMFNERGGATVEKVLPFGVLATPNLTEVVYTVVERGYQGTVTALHSQIRATGLLIEPAVEDDAIRAAELIAESRANADRGSLSLGDGLCIAIAERLSLPVIGGDTHWETLTLRTPHYPIR